MSKAPVRAGERTLLDTRLYHVAAVTHTLADGREREYQVIRHPGAAVIVPWTDGGKLLLVSQPRPAIGRDLLELPAGCLDPGEDPLTCAKRELEEETGCTAAEWRRLARFWPSPGILDEAMWMFEARGLAVGTADPDDDEEITLRETAPEEVAGLAAEGVIADAKTLLGLALAGVPLPAPGW
ncbi:MAG: NUDIX hydrolase [Planctomycetota bacterium]|jgi:ADP-ribose pyrophosphatase